MLARGEGTARTRHRRKSRSPARRATAPAACGWPRPRRRTRAAPAHERRTRVAAKASRNCASVAGHSWLRCGMVRRLATVRWHLPSAVSGAGETVAALAAHIAEADMALAASPGSAFSIPAPSSASQARCGRGCGTKMPWSNPSARLARILAKPFERGFARPRHLAGVLRRGEVAEAEAGIIVAGPDDAVEIDLDQRH